MEKLRLFIYSGLAGVLALPAVSSAATNFDAASTTAVVTDAVDDWGDVSIDTLGYILGVFALLLAAGFGISRVRKYLHGRKV